MNDVLRMLRSSSEARRSFPNHEPTRPPFCRGRQRPLPSGGRVSDPSEIVSA
jgi:hypothetical protein